MICIQFDQFVAVDLGYSCIHSLGSHSQKPNSNFFVSASEFKNKTATTIKRAILPETAMRVKEMLKWEYDLYDFVKQRFYNLYRKVKVLQSQGPDSDYRVRRKRNSAPKKNWEKALFSGSLKKPKS